MLRACISALYAVIMGLNSKFTWRMSTDWVCLSLFMNVIWFSRCPLVTQQHSKIRSIQMCTNPNSEHMAYQDASIVSLIFLEIYAYYEGWTTTLTSMMPTFCRHRRRRKVRRPSYFPCFSQFPEIPPLLESVIGGGVRTTNSTAQNFDIELEFQSNTSPLHINWNHSNKHRIPGKLY